MDRQMDMDQILGSTSPESCPLSCCPSVLLSCCPAVLLRAVLFFCRPAVLLSCCASVLLWCLQKGRKQIEGSHRPDGLILFSEKWSGAELLRVDLCRGGNRKSRWDKKYKYIYILFFCLAPQNIHQMDEGSGGGVKPFVKTWWLISDGCKNEVSAPCIWELRGSGL